MSLWQASVELICGGGIHMAEVAGACTSSRVTVS